MSTLPSASQVLEARGTTHFEHSWPGYVQQVIAHFRKGSGDQVKEFFGNERKGIKSKYENLIAAAQTDNRKYRWKILSKKFESLTVKIDFSDLQQLLALYAIPN